jgi:tetratricopeptide (TPR) repeat protein
MIWLGDKQRSASLRQQVYKLSLELLGPDNLQTNYALEQLGPMYFNLGDYAKALDAYTRSLPMLEKAYPPNHPSILNNNANRARILLFMNRVEEAVELAESTLNAVRDSVGTDHFLHRFVMLVLTEAYIAAGEFDKASSRIDESESYEKNNAPIDQMYSVRMKMLDFDLQQKKGDPIEAEYVGRELLKSIDAALGPMNEDALVFKGNFGVFLYSMNRSAEALPLFEQVHEARKSTKGGRKVPLLTAAYNRGCALLALNRKTEAYAFFEETLQGHEQLAEKNTDAEKFLNFYASKVQYDESLPDRDARAERLYERLVKVYESQYGPYSLEAVRAVGKQAWMMANQKKYAEAQTLQKAWYDRVDEAYRSGAASPEVKQLTVKQLAEAFQREEKASEAEPLWKELISLQTISLGRFHRDTQSSVGQLVKCFQSLGKLEEGESFLKERIQAAKEERHVDSVLHATVLLSQLMEVVEQGEANIGDASKKEDEVIEFLKDADRFGDEHGVKDNKSMHGILLKRLNEYADSQGRFDIAEYAARKELEMFASQTSLNLTSLRIDRLNRLIRSLAQQGRFEELPQWIETCEKEIALVKKSPFFAVNSFFLMTRISMAKGEYMQADEMVDRLLHAVQSSSEENRLKASFLKAEIAQLLGDEDDSSELFNEATRRLLANEVSKRREVVEAHVARAELLMINGKVDAAGALIDEPFLNTEKTTIDWRVKLLKGRVLVERGDLNSAISTFQEVAEAKSIDSEKFGCNTRRRAF